MRSAMGSGSKFGPEIFKQLGKGRLVQRFEILDRETPKRPLARFRPGPHADTAQPQGDANGSGSVDGADLAIWKAKFGTAGATAAVAAVPEPAAGILILSGIASLIRRRLTLGARPAHALVVPLRLQGPPAVRT